MPEVVVADEADTVVTALVAADDRDAVLTALEAIPPRCRELLRLMLAAPPLSYDDIAATLGVARGCTGPTRGRCIQHVRRTPTERGIRHIAAHSDQGKEAG